MATTSLRQAPKCVAADVRRRESSAKVNNDRPPPHVGGYFATGPDALSGLGQHIQKGCERYLSAGKVDLLKMSLMSQPVKFARVCASVRQRRRGRNRRKHP